MSGYMLLAYGRKEENRLQIKELSQKQVSERCLRYYETVGLLTAARQGNGYRQYEASAIVEVEKIRFYFVGT